MGYLGAKPANAIITSEQIADGVITAADLANNVITPAKMVNGGAEFGMRNRIINGDMRIDQRNAGASVSVTTAFVFGTDRWRCEPSVAGKLTMQQNAGSVTPPVGFTNYLGLTSTSAYSVSSGDYFWLEQFIEGYNIADLGFGTADAKTVTLSFWVYSSLTGQFGASITNGSTARCYPFNYTISTANTWTKISVTIAGDTTGTWAKDSSTGMRLNLSLGTGSSRLGSSSAWGSADYRGGLTGATSVVGTNGATFYITGVQLEVGSSATGFEYRHYQQELALCQRYGLAFNTPAHVGAGIWYSSSSVVHQITFPVKMRAAPSLTFTAVTIGAYGVNGLPTGTVPTLNTATENSFEFFTPITNNGGITPVAGQGTSTRVTVGSLFLTAEL
jgi:hypothetical protein